MRFPSRLAPSDVLLTAAGAAGCDAHTAVTFVLDTAVRTAMRIPLGGTERTLKKVE